jgi:hypothetical protein
MSTMIDIEMSASHAADFLADELADGRDYSRKLADMRRGRGSYELPFHRVRGRAYYYKTDLQAFVAAELAKSRAAKPMKKVERHEGLLGSHLPPSKVIGIIA